MATDKLHVFRDTVVATGHKNRVRLDELQSQAGTHRFLAGLLLIVRRFLNQLWAAIAQALTPRAQHMICVNEIRGALAWLTFLLGSHPVGLQLIIPATTLDFTSLEFTTDAAPWGMGATLESHGHIISWFRAADT